MFTIEQIKTAHAQVKSGEDFPAYIRDMKKIGVTRYEHFVTDGHTSYYGHTDFVLTGDPKWPAEKIATHASGEQLKQDLLAHQQGKTTYPAFCAQAAATGVEKWIVDLQQMTCTYYDLQGNEMLQELIPVV